MALPQPSASDIIDSGLSDEVVVEGYGKETYTLLKYVLQEITTEQNDNDNIKKEFEFPLERAQRYTGLQMDTLETLYTTDRTIDKLTEINRRCIHYALMSYYLEKHVMPTSTELFHSLQDTLPFYEDIRSFRKKLVKMGYIFKKKDDCFVVYEKPSIRFERFLYLKNIMQYRQKKRPIYFLSELGITYNKVWNVDESILDKNARKFLFFFAVSSIKGVHFLKKVQHFDKANFNSWILNDVIPNLETNVVVILDNTNHHCDKFYETPKKISPSYVMTEWLTLHGIPFNDTMSSVELYTLIETYTDVHVRLFKPDTWLKQNGHDVLRLPNCINDLTPAAHVRHLLSKGLMSEENLTKTIADTINGVSETELRSYDLILAKEETQLYNLEIQLDIVLDKLKPSFNTEKDLYLPFLSDSD